MFKEILEARHILQNDIKVRLEEIVNNFMKKNEDNDEHVSSYEKNIVIDFKMIEVYCLFPYRKIFFTHSIISNKIQLHNLTPIPTKL